jgi:FixJ family two-component response regulator
MNSGPTEIAPVVCLVDDDPSIRRSLTRMLEFDGMSVRAFKEPEPFLAHITDHVAQLAIVDMGMGKMTAMELLTTVREKSPTTRIIFISGDEDHGADLPVGQAGAYAFFVKPFDDSEFLRSVHQALAHFSPKAMDSPFGGRAN